MYVILCVYLHVCICIWWWKVIWTCSLDTYSQTSSTIKVLINHLLTAQPTPPTLYLSPPLQSTPPPTSAFHVFIPARLSASAQRVLEFVCMCVKYLGKLLLLFPPPPLTLHPTLTACLSYSSQTHIHSVPWFLTPDLHPHLSYSSSLQHITVYLAWTYSCSLHSAHCLNPATTTIPTPAFIFLKGGC